MPRWQAPWATPRGMQRKSLDGIRNVMTFMSEPDLTFVGRAVEKIGTGREKVLEILQAIQGEFGYLPTEALERVCELTEITPAAIAGVSTFYNQFRHRPAGRHIINICVGTACHVKGADQVYDAFRRHLAIPDGDDTDSQKLFTVEKIACLGCCTLAPAAQIGLARRGGQVTYGHLTPDAVPTVISDFLRYEQAKAARRHKARKPQKKQAKLSGEIRIGLGSCCVARGSGKLRDALDEALSQTGIQVAVKRVGCVGMCYQTPLLEVVLPDQRSFLYARVQPGDAKAIVLRHFKVPGISRKISNRVSAVLDGVLTDRMSEPVTRYSINVREGHVADFLGKQVRIATEHCGHIDPVDLDEYLSYDGFAALKKCVPGLQPEQIIAEIEKSGLRGRGGAGFPTHLKWAAVRRQISPKKHIVCNGDEGDPGAFMDRMLMESYPYRILEGMIIAAYAVGADEGYLYIRAEYPLAVERVGRAIEVCKERGILGDNIFGTGFSLGLKIVPGAGASKGTKVFALAGKIARGGLIEVPMGISIREIVHEIGGGIAGGLRFKAVQVGGPSGGCVPASLADTPVDYETLKDVGAMMGSGGLVVLDESDCMVDIARYFLQFTQNQSCGRCTFCRVGTRRMLDILDRLCAGEGKKTDIDELENLARMVQASSLCGLGKTAPNPVLSTIRYFRSEYEAHIEKRCPTAKCKALITYSVTDDCIGCTLCARHCPADAIEYKPYEKHEIDAEKCIRCGTCRNICPADAVKVE